MQISLRCAGCGHVYINDSDKDLSLEIDFMQEELRFVCREAKCHKINKISFAQRRKTQPLPGILASRQA